jgi:hypothetical protein
MTPTLHLLLLQACTVIHHIIALIPDSDEDGRREACNVVLDTLTEDAEVLLGQMSGRRH